MKRLVLPFLSTVAFFLLVATQQVEIIWGARAFRALPWVKLLFNLLMHSFFVTVFVLGPYSDGVAVHPCPGGPEGSFGWIGYPKSRITAFMAVRGI